MAAAAAAVPAASTTTTTPANAPAISSSSSNNNIAAQFREIHKNTWLKRLTADGKKLTVGPKVNSKGTQRQEYKNMYIIYAVSEI